MKHLSMLLLAAETAEFEKLQKGKIVQRIKIVKNCDYFFPVDGKLCNK